ncbi:hypothetical protein M427DRAFT_355253 [Gonapodya prolifera JEL478]|uniref:Uncharacterized protein n=1 Tax=Gonapodya prolifera (strain JEL478) TaxID=1344416 RepID=A0A139ACL2_GONPJ|nr:hypothetical protein M427DRAFT_355253 [Gonapodya prolifera JEL478]|eukprot:KXS14153.1 hypothetical protein M427DRAFT_355253 [Gonapodya prolifera JEL478]
MRVTCNCCGSHVPICKRSVPCRNPVDPACCVDSSCTAFFCRACSTTQGLPFCEDCDDFVCREHKHRSDPLRDLCISCGEGAREQIEQ